MAHLFKGRKQQTWHKQGNQKLKSKNISPSYKSGGKNAASNVAVISLEAEMCQVMCQVNFVN